MVDKQSEILSEIKELKSWLYGANGHTGDIPEIKKCINNHDERIRRNELIIVGLIASSSLGAGIFGLIKWLGS